MSSLTCLIGLSLICLINCASLSQSNIADRLGLPSGNDLTPLSSSNADPLGDSAVRAQGLSLMGRSSSSSSSLSSETPSNTKKQDPLGDFAIRSALAQRSASTPAPTSLSPLSSLSPSRLIPMLSSATSRVNSVLPVHALAMRPINRLLDLLPSRYDYDDSGLTGRNTISSHGSRVHPGERRQDQFNGFTNVNGLTSMHANDPLPDLMKQGQVAKAPWLPNTFQGTNNQQNNNRRSTFRNIVNRIFG